MSENHETTNGQPVVILDYGMGNICSVANMIKRVGGQASVSGDPRTIASANKIILPGVGHFASGMKNLAERGLTKVLNQAMERSAHILGICLGMQLMTQWSDEGNCDGLGWFDHRTIRFPARTSSGDRLLVPHMGWNAAKADRTAKQFENLPVQPRFYFVHSYYVDAAGASDCLATTEYGDITFASAFGRDNLLGVQFHPEKSHKHGMALLRSFVEL